MSKVRLIRAGGATELPLADELELAGVDVAVDDVLADRPCGLAALQATGVQHARKSVQ
jgi:hypothetical protein